MGKLLPPQSINDFDEHAVAIAKRQYFQPGDNDLAGLFGRVADWVASPESAEERAHYRQAFLELMTNKRFCPGGRVLAGAATSHGNVLNCFVQDASPFDPSSTKGVLHLATKLALVTKVGGGNGLNLDPLPPKRPYPQCCGTLTLTISPKHPDYAKVQHGTYMDLVHGRYLTKGYRVACFAEHDSLPDGPLRVTVGDSVESIWQGASDVVTALLAERDVILDLSDLRPEGTPVKGSGGSSSGPSSFAVEIFDNFAYWASLGGAEYAGPIATLRYIYASTLRVIRQGGTRRGAGMATLSVDHPDIHDFITCKDIQREKEEGDISTFNISVLVGDDFMQRSKRDQGVLYDIADHAWQTGEPGLIFIDRINQHSPMRESLGEIKATNPCVTADTWVATHLGAKQVRDLIGKKFCAVVDGKRYGLASEGFWLTGQKPVFKVTTKRGFELRLTGNHKLKKIVRQTRYRQEDSWVEVEQLALGDHIALSNHRRVTPWVGRGTFAEGWLLGALVGDGTFATDKREVRACLDFWGEGRETLADLVSSALEKLFGNDTSQWITRTKDKVRIASSDLAKLAARYGIIYGCKKVTDEVEQASFDFYQGFLCALFDTDGSVQGCQQKGVSVRLAQSDLALLKRVQRMLARIGIISTVYAERRPEGHRHLPDGQGGSRPYYCRADHELLITNDNLLVFQDVIGFEDVTKQRRLTQHLEGYQRTLNRERFEDKIAAIAFDGEENVYDVTVEHIHAFDANGIAAHNCGEIPLFPGEPCDLGAINLAAYVKTPDEGIAGFDWASFEADTKTCIRFLDNVLEVNKFALDDNREMSMRLRRLGLGVMGLADALILMGYRYDSAEGRDAVERMITRLREHATEASYALAAERGAFPEFANSSLTRERRNIALLTVAPTGTTSMLMGVSSGVEPIFAPFIYRKIGSEYKALISPLFKDMLGQHTSPPDFDAGGAWDWDKVVEEVQGNHGSVQGLLFIPEEVRRVFVCAHDISPADHVQMQGVVQSAFDAGGEMVSNSISKTINMPNHATVKDVYGAYSLAFDSGCKGITVYRDGSRDFQVLSTSSKKDETKEAKDEAKPQAAPASQPERLPSEPLFDRPGRLEGFTDRVKLTLATGEKRGFYVTVNKQDGLPVEVFITSGKAGDEANADSEALGRMVSIALQYGVPSEAIAHSLRGINGGVYGTYQGRMVTSKADLIAVALETAGVTAAPPVAKGADCPEHCGGKLVREEGCLKCYTCGYSKCG